ncbi:MAG: hypothetical protein IJ875_00660 [Solobacterium sp.]|nr:hypothetical protein [Solobacterium sp.]
MKKKELKQFVNLARSRKNLMLEKRLMEEGFPYLVKEEAQYGKDKDAFVSAQYNHYCRLIAMIDQGLLEIERDCGLMAADVIYKHAIEDWSYDRIAQFYRLSKSSLYRLLNEWFEA